MTSSAIESRGNEAGVTGVFLVKGIPRCTTHLEHIPCLSLMSVFSDVGVGGAGGTSAPQKFKFVKNLGKISKKLDKSFDNCLTILLDL